MVFRRGLSEFLPKRARAALHASTKKFAELRRIAITHVLANL